MRIIYLPIRSFGDFIITASVIKNNFAEKIPVVLPDYLIELFLAIDGNNYFDIADTMGYHDQPAFFELYKVKDIKNLKRLIKDIYIIGSSLSRNDQYLLDYSSKRLFFIGLNFVWPSKMGNIYDEKFKMFESKNLLNSNSQSTTLIAPVEPGRSSRILIFPDSRLNSKRIDNNLVDLIINEFGSKGNKISTARFSKKRIRAVNIYIIQILKSLLL